MFTTSKFWGPHTTVPKIYASSFWPIQAIRFIFLLFTRNDEEYGDYDDDDHHHHYHH
jgi:hypothetical protein